MVGAGQFGTEHIRAYQANPRCRVVAVVDHVIGVASAVAQKMGIPRYYASLSEAMSSIHIDAASVATPSIDHVASAEVLLDADIPVLLEKPITLSYADAAALQIHAKRSSAFIMPAHLLRFSPAYSELKRRIVAGVVGQPVAMSFHRHRGRDHAKRFANVHPAFMTAIHDIDLAIWLTGSIGTLTHATCLGELGSAQPSVVGNRPGGELSGLVLRRLVGAQPSRPNHGPSRGLRDGRRITASIETGRRGGGPERRPDDRHPVSNCRPCW